MLDLQKIAQAKTKEEARINTLEFVRQASSSTQILGTKDLPKVDITQALNKCKAAHPGRECVDVRTMEPEHYSYQQNGAAVACHKGNKPVWTLTSFQCQINLKENRRAV